MISQELLNLEKKVCGSGHITLQGVELLNDYFKGVLSVKELNFIYDLKDKIVKEKAVPEFYDLFISLVTRSLLEDEDSPGEINDKEAKWLRAKINRKGFVDKYDKLLLKELKKKSVTYPEILNFKSSPILWFEKILFSLRFITFLAVIGSVLSSVVLFIASSFKVVEGIAYAYNNLGRSVFSVNEQIMYFVKAIDGYLFATVLVVFSMGIYELFINKIDPANIKYDDRPKWLKIHNIDDLKNYLGKVILMILVVTFFEYSVELQYKSPMDILLLAIGVALVSFALYLTHKPKDCK